ncbi:FAD-binding domain-containing protein [Xylariaceae sp. AK1471]|nr:FAD-binding domain-containing protein [Xylariaceae sp. AK1471]
MLHNSGSALITAITCTWLLGSPAVGRTIDSYNSHTTTVRSTDKACKPIPGDRNWPTTAEWDKLNATVSGRLIATEPIAHVCHAPSNPQSEACKALRMQWGVAELQTSQPAEFLAPWFQNQSCTPFGAENSPCRLGNYASYSINVSSSEDIVAGLAFAQRKNVRLVVKNTGHDLQGKSTGKGALSLWTHNMKDMKLVSKYQSKYYNGPAIKAGAGVQIAEAVTFAAKSGFRTVVGSCPTVGVAGGYSQGGGYGLLASLYGLGADNVLEWEVVTIDGKLLKASPTQNLDLYWALAGGGGGTYGVVISMTARVFQDGPVSSASFFFSTASAGSVDAYWNAIGLFHNRLPALVDQKGIVLSYSVSKDVFILYTVTAPNRTANEVVDLLRPLTSELETAGLSLQSMGFNTTESATYAEYYGGSLEPVLAESPISPVAGDRFISRANMANNAAGVIKGFQDVTASGNFTLACVALNVNKSHIASAVADNAVSPAWRSALATCIIGSVWSWGQSWDLVLEQQKELETSILPAFEAATPGAAAYLNEANFAQSDWQRTFYGANYARLTDIKNRYDPKGVLYGVTAVGSEHWAEDGDGRLCRK